MRYLSTWAKGETIKKVGPALFNHESSTAGKVLVIFNGGMMHHPSKGCDGTWRAHVQAGMDVLTAWTKANPLVAGVELVLLGPPAVLGLRNPGVTWVRGRAFVPLLQRYALESNALQAELPGGGKIHTSVLDQQDVTVARWDVTFDGMHFGGTVTSTLVSMVLQHIGCS